jgi:hypothetical protein
MTIQPSSHRLLLCALLAVPAGFIGAVEPQSPASPAAAARKSRATVVVVTPAPEVLRAASEADPSLTQLSGQKAHIDPVTKKLREPTPEESKKLSDELALMFKRDSSGLIPVYHANGSVSIDLQGQFMSAAVARIGSDGKLIRACVTNAAHAEAFMSSGRQAPNSGGAKEVSNEK